MDSDGGSFVVVADTYFAGWSATIDGLPAPLLRVYHALRGAYVPTGEHVLAMRYVPEGWTAGVALSRFAWIAWLVSCLAFAILRFEPGLHAARSRTPRSPR